MGITVCQMLTGKLPYSDSFAQHTLFQFIFALGNDDDTGPVVPEDLPDPDAKDFAASCLRRDPSLRPSVEMLLVHNFVSK